MGKQLRDITVRFRVGYKFSIDGEEYEGEETESSWYLIDQQGKFYSYGPMKPVTPCTDESTLEFRLKIGDEYLTVAEIEERSKQ